MKSNCLFEAIKAKIKDPQNITIHILSPKLNNGELHVYWFDKKDNHIYHYTYLDEDSCYFFFEGKISSHNIKLFESKLYSRMKTLNWSDEKQKAYAIKKGFQNLEPFSINFQK